MAWKIENWLADVFPGAPDIYHEYRHLTRRELVIVSAGVLDIALAQLLSMRLRGTEHEKEEFLGLNGDGRAPVGSFGARIQLGLLTGILTSEDVEILRIIKNLRNYFAHRVKVDFTSPEVLPLVRKLCEKWEERINKIVIESSSPKIKGAGISEIRKYLEFEPEAGAGLLLSIFTVYQAYFHRLIDLVNPIEDVVSNRMN